MACCSDRLAPALHHLVVGDANDVQTGRRVDIGHSALAQRCTKVAPLSMMLLPKVALDAHCALLSTLSRHQLSKRHWDGAPLPRISRRAGIDLDEAGECRRPSFAPDFRKRQSARTIRDQSVFPSVDRRSRTAIDRLWSDR